MSSESPDRHLRGIDASSVAIDAAILVVAAGLRFAALGADGLWLDEASTAVVAGLPTPELLATVAADNQAPLWFLVVRLVTALAGASEWAVRLPSAIVGTAAVGATLVAGRRLLSPTAARAAAVLLATSPMAVHYAREARGYALLMLLAVLGFWAATRFAERPRRLPGAALVAIGAAMIYAHNLGGFFVVGLWTAGVLAAPFDRRRRRAWLAVVLLTAAAVAPWAPVVARQVDDLDHSFGWARQLFRAEAPWQPARSVAAMSHGAGTPVRNRVPDLSATAWIGGAFMLLLAAAGIAARHRFRNPAAPAGLVVAIAVPLVGIWLASWILPTPLYVVGRVDAALVPLLLLVAASGLERLPRWAIWGAVAACVGLALPALDATFRIDTRSQDKMTALRVAAFRRPGEPVVATNLEAALHFYTSAGREGVLLRFPSGTRRFMNWSEMSSEDHPRLAADAREVSARAAVLAAGTGRRRVWLLRGPGPAGDAIEAALGTHGVRREASSTRYLGLAIEGFEITTATPDD